MRHAFEQVMQMPGIPWVDGGGKGGSEMEPFLESFVACGV